MFLAQRERRLYQQMAQYRPELIIRLGIDIETAISRKPDHDYAELQDKIGVMSTIGYNGTKILEIDSRAPLQRSAGTGTEGGFLWLPSFLTAEV